MNPKFSKTFVIDYHFERTQPLQFVCYDVDSASSNLADHDFIGQMETTLGEVVGSRGAKLTKSLLSKHAKVHGFCTIHAEECSTCEDEVELSFRGSKLAKKDFFGKSGTNELV